MNINSTRPTSCLRRLDPQAYTGLAQVHWAMTIRGRRTGWLTPAFSLEFREILVHAAFRYGICMPIYCLMPDHMHLLCAGFDQENSDQHRALRFIRRHGNALLRRSGGFEFQQQGYDHVLRESERERDAFQAVAWYIQCNPVRAGLVATDSAEDLARYRFLGCVLPGYPELSFWQEDYWMRFWRIYATLLAGR